MTTPRFKKGQVVVVYGLHAKAHYNGMVGTVLSSEHGMRHDDTYTSLVWTGWWYWTDIDPLPFPEIRLRPYDPPSSWNHPDMVWRPKELERESTDAIRQA